MLGQLRIAHSLLLAAPLAPAAAAQVTQRVSVATSGQQSTADSAQFGVSVSGDGRYVAFDTLSRRLAAGDLNSLSDVVVRDRLTGTTELASATASNLPGNGNSFSAAISADGRFVAFVSVATDFAPGGPPGALQVYVRDRLALTTERASVDSAGIPGDSHSLEPAISADGRYVTFSSVAGNLVAGDGNLVLDVFVRDRIAGTTERVSVDPAGLGGDSHSSAPAISTDGRFVAFESQATNLVPGDANGRSDVFVRDRLLGATERSSTGPGGIEGDGDSLGVSVSADGSLVAFWSLATNLVAGDGNAVADVFVHDRPAGATVRASVGPGGVEGDGESTAPEISADGRCVVFTSLATNLVDGDTNATYDVFLRDRVAGTTERASLEWAGAQARAQSLVPSVNSDGRFVGFASLAVLVPNDTNGFRDVYVRDRLDGTSFTSACDAGSGGVIPCPCGNPPSGPGRGCDNSAGTGGATIAASGCTSLSSDSLVFTTNDERPRSLSILAQWNAGNATGIVFGMGVRCASGTLKRLFSRNAVGGSVTFPSFGLGELTVSARSAAKGDPISAGQSRWYAVYYRDPNVLGGCPPLASFNATPTGEVVWSP